MGGLKNDLQTSDSEMLNDERIPKAKLFDTIWQGN